MREQRLVFGEVAELYDKARPGYPPALIADVISFAWPGGASLRALEVGAGTGKATVGFAAHGLEILALEPSAAMAAFARLNCEQFPRVRIQATSFEDWPAEEARFGLVFCAQAWHWVNPAVRYRKAATALRPGGTLALFWHRTRGQAGPLRDELDDLYRRLAPELHGQRRGLPGLSPRVDDSERRDELAGTGLFGDVRVRTYPWSATFTAGSYTDLLLTQSDHRLLAEQTRTRLLDGVREIIERRGGEVVVPHSTFLVMGRLVADRGR